MRRIWFLALFLALLGAVIWGGLTLLELLTEENAEPQPEQEEMAPQQPEEPPSYTRTLKLAAVGDIMMHMPQVNSGLQADGTHDFRPFFAQVRQRLSEADLAIGNLETTFAGEQRGYSGYPRFNSPDALAQALAEAGFDIITTANNHSLDTGESGLIRTLDVLDQHQLQHTGTFRSAEEREQLLIVEKNDISLAILAYTYGTNGIPIPEGKPYLVNLLEEEQVERDVRRAKAAGVDLIAVMVHFGNEYQRQPSEEQKRWVERFRQLGVDLVLGSHPHVVQPYTLGTYTAPDGTERDFVAIYSMGNFISNQRGDYKDVGVIFEVVVEKHFPEGTVTLKEVSAQPTYVDVWQQDGKRHYQVMLMEDILHGGSQSARREELLPFIEVLYPEMQEHLASMAPVASEAP